jgi:hypothetical protein
VNAAGSRRPCETSTIGPQHGKKKSTKLTWALMLSKLGMMHRRTCQSVMFSMLYFLNVPLQPATAAVNRVGSNHELGHLPLLLVRQRQRALGNQELCPAAWQGKRGLRGHILRSSNCDQRQPTGSKMFIFVGCHIQKQARREGYWVDRLPGILS